MKLAQMTLILALLGFAGWASASQRNTANVATCKYEASDIGRTIVGHGSNLNAARADASSQCFDMRMDYYERRNPSSEDLQDRGLLFIDACVNIRCS